MNEKEEILQPRSCSGIKHVFPRVKSPSAATPITPRLLSLTANNRADGSPYKITLLEGHVKVNGYTLPNIVLSRRDSPCQRS